MIKKLNVMLAYGVVLMFLIVTLYVPTAQAKNPIQEKNNYTFLLKNPNQLKAFLKELDPEGKNLKVTVIEEIGLVYIENYDELGNSPEKITGNNQSLGSYISEEGRLPDFEITLTQPNVIGSDLLATKINKEIIENEGKQFLQLSSPNLFPFNWYLTSTTNNFASYSISKGKNTKIALIDSGVESSHPLLANNINLKQAKNYTSEEAENIYDEMGHGTSVAGIITSIAPETTIVPYKVLAEKTGHSIWVLKAIIDAVNDSNDIINLSLGTLKSKKDYDEQLLIKAYELAVKYAIKKDVLLISSSGNQGINLDELKKQGQFYLPGHIDDVINVSSNTKQDTLASYSNFGKAIDFSAPGGDIVENYDVTELVITTFPVDRPNTFLDQMIGIPEGYTLSYGTSFAAPQVSATAALIISKYNANNKKDAQIKDVIKYLTLKEIRTPLEDEELEKLKKAKKHIVDYEFDSQLEKRIEVYIDMLSEDKYTSYQNGKPDDKNIFGSRNKVLFKGYEHINGLNTSQFWSNNSSKIISTIESKIKYLNKEQIEYGKQIIDIANNL